MPPPRPDQIINPPAAVVYPGSSNTVIAKYVIVFASGGLFVYEGTPGPDNPPVCAITEATEDRYGNTVQPLANFGYLAGAHFGLDNGGTAYLANASGDTQILLSPEAAFIGIYEPAAAAGNLQTSMAAAAGPGGDTYGNPYPAGFASYFSTTQAVNLSQAALQWLTFAADSWNTDTELSYFALGYANISGTWAVNNNEIWIAPTGDTTGADDTEAINSALAGNLYVHLLPGQYWIASELKFTGSGQHIRGAGRTNTVVTCIESFGSSDAFLINGYAYCGISGLALEGPTSGSMALGGDTQLNGIHQTGQSERCLFSDLYVSEFNGWGWYFDGSGGNNAETILEDIVFQDCAGSWYMQGDTSGYLGSINCVNVTSVNIGTSTGPAASFVAGLLENADDCFFFNATPAVIENCSTCSFYAVDQGGSSTAPAVTINGGSDLSFSGGTMQGGNPNLYITGEAQKIRFDGVRFSGAYTSGVEVNSSGLGIMFSDCLFDENNSGGNSDTYDLDWPGTSTGLVSNCLFNTAIGSGDSEVDASVNIASGQLVMFTDCNFRQNSTHGTVFTNVPVQVTDCLYYNPVGSISVSVPSSGGTTSALGVPATFYVTAAANGGCTVQTIAQDSLGSDGPSITVSAGTQLAVFVPAVCGLKVTYTDAPTWLVQGH